MNIKERFLAVIRIPRETRVLLVLLSAAFVLKIYLLYERSLCIDPDEGYYLLLAHNLISGNGYSLNGLPNIVFPPLLPLMISAFSVLWRDIQFTLMFITAISGAMIGAVCYLLARRKFSPFASVFCAFLALFSYQLNAFLPIPKPYIGSLYRGSEILNCLLVLSAIYFFVRFIEKDRVWLSILSGCCLAGAYLTRPEGLLFFIVMLLGLSLITLLGQVSVSRKSMLFFVLSFILLSSPYWIYLRTVTGEWSLSGKIAASRQYREALLRVIEEEEWRPFQRIHYSFDRQHLEMTDAYWGYHPMLESGNRVSGGSLVGNAVENLRLYYLVPKILLPVYILVFFLIGLAVGIYKAVKRKSIVDAVLLLLVPYSIMIVALSYPIPRHHLFLVPMFCIYCVEGMWFLLELAARWRAVIKQVLLVLFSLVLVAFMAVEYMSAFEKNVLNNHEFTRAQMAKYRISQFLREHEARVVMSSYPDIAVGAASDWQVKPLTDLASLTEFGKKKGVDYLVIRRPLKGQYSYYIIDLEASYIPQGTGDPVEFQVLEQHADFDLVRLTNRGPQPG